MSGGERPFPAARGPACVSDLRIDMWLAGDLPAADQAAARAHVAGCAACAARVEAITSARARARGDAASAAGLEALRRAAGAPEVPAARRRRWAPLWAGAGAAMCALVVVVVAVGRGPGDGGGGAQPEAREAALRVKGGPRLGFFVSHGGAVRRGGPDESVSPGDGVRFTVTTEEPLRVAVIAVDAGGAATVFFPPDGRMGPPLPAGRDAPLPRATELDGTLGPETVYALFCRAPIDLEAARRALAGEPLRPVAPVSDRARAAVAGCQIDRVTWTKERAP